MNGDGAEADVKCRSEIWRMRKGNSSGMRRTLVNCIGDTTIVSQLILFPLRFVPGSVGTNERSDQFGFTVRLISH